jgi:putative oxidoreductase
VADDRNLDWTGWLLRAFVCIAFVVIGLDKFDPDPHNEWVRIFAQIGFGQWFRYVTGVVEVGGAILYLFPRTVIAGAVLLGGAMAGAILAHLTVLHDPITIIIPLALLAVVVGIAIRIPDEPIGERRTKGAR